MSTQPVSGVAGGQTANRFRAMCHRLLSDRSDERLENYSATMVLGAYQMRHRRVPDGLSVSDAQREAGRALREQKEHRGIHGGGS